MERYLEAGWRASTCSPSGVTSGVMTRAEVETPLSWVWDVSTTFTTRKSCFSLVVMVAMAMAMSVVMEVMIVVVLILMAILVPELHCGTMGEADPVPAAPHRQHELRHDEAGEDAWQGGGKGSPEISTPHMLWR